MNTIAINLPRPLFFKEGWLQWAKRFFMRTYNRDSNVQMNVS